LLRHAIHQGLLTAARIPIARAFVYGAEALRYWALYQRAPELSNLLREYRDWRRSQAHRQQPLAERVPWLTFGAIRFLAVRLQREMRVFEYGSGGSTLFFAQHARSVVSVEHDVVWSAEVRQAAAALKLENVTILDVLPGDSIGPGPDPADPDAYISRDPPYTRVSFRAYASAIDAFADRSFDVILVDGRARPSCVKHAIGKLAPGGMLILDNAERGHYALAGKKLDDLGWQRHDFAGPGPLNAYFWKTSIWLRPT
jgi:predicted O-methyltransferase YrrM